MNDELKELEPGENILETFSPLEGSPLRSCYAESQTQRMRLAGTLPARKQSSATQPYFHLADLQPIGSDLQLQAPLLHTLEC